MWSNAQQQQNVASVLSDNPWGSNSTTSTSQQPTTNDIDSTWATFPTDNFADFDSHFDSFDMPPPQGEEDAGNESTTNDDKEYATTHVEEEFFDSNMEDSHDEITV